ncbi:MAG: hypothetical protein GXO19_06550 [Epsilonproteobacteria bacterium]|nr:hypothetical protein [Campylobacterota bacterium]NPA57377.1 hypothetical protein [Campylobacterota bacterium]
MRNEALRIAVNHLQLASTELGECAQKVSKELEEGIGISERGEAIDVQTLLDALTALQMQDIVTQRLQKVQDFLKLLDQHLLIKSSEEFLDRFAWENEVNQEEIDRLFK